MEFIKSIENFFKKEYYYLVASIKTNERKWLQIYLDEYHNFKYGEFRSKVLSTLTNGIKGVFKFIFILIFCTIGFLGCCGLSGCLLAILVVYPGIFITLLFISLYLIFLWYYTKGEMFCYFEGVEEIWEKGKEIIQKNLAGLKH